MSQISLRNVYKSYDKNKPVIKNFSLEIFDDEFLVFVGPSGSGKTTTLRMIAGLEETSSGEIWIDQELQNDKDPSTRHLSFVFQNYALFPNLTTYQNIEFGLLNKKVTKLEKRRNVEHIAKKLSLLDKLGSYPNQLSGGQRQRVALARALVDNEKLILFDEPLSNLDAVLRQEMRSEIIRLQREFVTTCIYVTHDQVEAMAMANRVVLMIEGKIIQVGTPEQMYNHPAHMDVAGFIGTPEINTFSATRLQNQVYVNGIPVDVNNDVMKCISDQQLEEFYLAIRPQDIKVHVEPQQNRITGKLILIEHFGVNKLLHIDTLKQSVRVLVDKDFQEKDTYFLDFSGQMFIFNNEKKRVFNSQHEIISFDQKPKDERMLKVVKELENYGYIISFDNQNPQVKWTNSSQMYELSIGNKRIKLSNPKDLLNYFSYIQS